MERRAEYIRMSFAGDDSVILKEVKARLRELSTCSCAVRRGRGCI